MVTASRSLLLFALLIQLAGCASNSTKAPGYFATENDPVALQIHNVALVSDTTPPEITSVTLGTTRGEGAVAGAGEGALTGALAALEGMGECSGAYCGAALLLVLPAFTIGGAVIGGFTGHAAGKPDDALAQAEARAKQALNSAYLQAELLHKAANYGYNTPDIRFVALPTVETGSLLTRKERATIDGKPVDHVLEIDLLRLSLVYSLEMQARARLISLKTGDILSEVEYRFVSEPRELEGWMADGFAPLTETIERGLRTLAEDVIDEYFLLYYPASTDAGKLAQPTGSNKDGGDSKQPTRAGSVPHFVLSPVYPQLEGCFLCGGTPFKQGQRTFAYFTFVDVGNIHPTLRWESFPGDRDLRDAVGKQRQITNVTYEIRIFSAARAGEYLTAGQLVYEARNLREPYHAIDNTLSACTNYLWTVRARFEIDGRIRVTEWAGTYGWGGSAHAPWNLRRSASAKSPGTNPSPGSFYYPFRTPCQ